MPGSQKIYDEEGNIIGGESNPINVEGNVSVLGIAKPTQFYTNQVDIPNTTNAVPLVASSTPLTVGRVEITSMPTNDPTSLIFVGASGVIATSGHALSPDKTTVVYIDDLSKVYVRTNFAGSDVSYQAS